MKNRVSAKLTGWRQDFSCFALRRLRRISEVSGEEKEGLRRCVLALCTGSVYWLCKGTAAVHVTDPKCKLVAICTVRIVTVKHNYGRCAP